MIVLLCIVCSNGDKKNVSQQDSTLFYTKTLSYKFALYLLPFNNTKTFKIKKPKSNNMILQYLISRTNLNEKITHFQKLSHLTLA